MLVNSRSPVLGMCRKLVAAGYDPATPLHAYRGATLCLTVRSIGAAAKLEVSGTSFVVASEGRRIGPYTSPAGPAAIPNHSGPESATGEAIRPSSSAAGGAS
jgi:hypothetical protein